MRSMGRLWVLVSAAPVWGLPSLIVWQVGTKCVLLHHGAASLHPALSFLAGRKWGRWTGVNDGSSEHAAGLPARLAPPAADSSVDAEVSVTPAPNSDMVLVDSGSGGAGAAGGAAAVAPRAPLGSDDADMQDDAVMLEYETAEQLVSLSLADTPEDPPAGASAKQHGSNAGEGGEPDEGSGSAAAASAGGAQLQRAGQSGGGEATNGPAAVSATSA